MKEEDIDNDNSLSSPGWFTRVPVKFTRLPCLNALNRMKNCRLVDRAECCQTCQLFFFSSNLKGIIFKIIKGMRSLMAKAMKSSSFCMYFGLAHPYYSTPITSNYYVAVMTHLKDFTFLKPISRLIRCSDVWVWIISITNTRPQAK